MRKRNWILFGIALFLGIFIVTVNAQAGSPETERLLKILQKRGIITQAEAIALLQEVEAGTPQGCSFLRRYPGPSSRNAKRPMVQINTPKRKKA